MWCCKVHDSTCIDLTWRFNIACTCSLQKSQRVNFQNKSQATETSCLTSEIELQRIKPARVSFTMIYFSIHVFPRQKRLAKSAKSWEPIFHFHHGCTKNSTKSLGGFWKPNMPSSLQLEHRNETRLCSQGSLCPINGTLPETAERVVRFPRVVISQWVHRQQKVKIGKIYRYWNWSKSSCWSWCSDFLQRHWGCPAIALGHDFL